MKSIFQKKETIQRSIVGVDKRVVSDSGKTKRQLMDELEQVRARVYELEAQLYLGNSDTSWSDTDAAYRSLFEQGSDAIFVLDGGNGAILDVNENASEYLGYDRDELLCMNTRDLLADHEQPNFRSRFGHAKKNLSQSFDVDHRHKDGRAIPVEVRARYVVIGDREIVLAAVRDMTERKRAERALKESEQRFRDFANSAADRFWETDENHVFTYVSPIDEQALLRQPDGFLGRTRFEVHDIDLDLEKWRQHREDIEAHRPFRDFRATVRRANGEIAYLRLNGTPIFDEDGNFRGYRGTTVDETAEVEARERLIRVQQRFLAALESVSEGTTLWDSDLRLVMCNSKALAVNEGVADVMVPGATYEDILRRRVEAGNYQGAEEDPEAWIAARIADMASDADIEREFYRDDRWIHFRKKRLPDGSCLTLSSDITDQKQREEDLRQAQKMEAVGQLTGGIAHDFNNLLGAILGNLELIGARVKDDETVTHRIDRAIASVQRGATLTNRLLAFSRRQALNASVTSLNTLIEDMFDLLQRSLGETVTIETNLAPDLWPASIDQNQLENALLNLSINARDAMKAGGTLSISTSNVRIEKHGSDENPEIAAGDYIALTVRDDGCGMSEEVLQHAFDPFYTTKDIGQGSGLGLSMVYGFVKQSGGDIRINSRIGKGTTVTIRLPRVVNHVQAAEAHAAESLIPSGRGERILLIEDDSAIRDVTKIMLTDLGYDVVDGGDGTAMSDGSIDLEGIDVLLTDVVLPCGRNGPEIAEFAKMICPDLLVLFMSGYSQAVGADGLLHEGSPVFLHKPFKKRELGHKIRDLLDGVSAAA
jgi:PAS domain S-box-containing protein